MYIVIIIASWMTHPLFLLFIVIVSFLFGEPKFDFWNILIWIFIWLFLNLIFGRNSYLYKLWERKKSERIIATIKETELKKLESEKEDKTKNPTEKKYKLWGGVGEKVERSNKQIYEEYLKEREIVKRKN